MLLIVDVEPHIFFELEKGHGVTTVAVPRGPLLLGEEFKLNIMFQMWKLLDANSMPVGFYFYSPFRVVNRGGVIATFRESKRGRAKTSRVVVRMPELVVYDVEGCGAIAVTTKVNDSIKSIITEQ